MLLSDLTFILQWWLTFFSIGIIFLPITNLLFSNFSDKGYAFSKIIGITIITYIVFVLGTLKIAPYDTISIFSITAICLIVNILVAVKFKTYNLKKFLPIFLLEECLFLITLLFWAYIHAHQPDIFGLEKYMDFGFINSILRTKYFPPLDMWFTPLSINYYYFGHLITATLTKISSLPSSITYNLMLSVLPAIGISSSFSIIFNLLRKLYEKKSLLISISGGLLSSLILNFAGNLHAIYLFFKPYANENPVPLWELVFSPNTFPNSYWYPNATRFIHNTIHEFPIYSNVVSDLHGHFLDIPLVLLTVAILLSLFLRDKREEINWKLEIPLLSFLMAVMYMTNAWDGIIYFLLTIIIIFCIKFEPAIDTNHKYSIKYYISSIMRNKKPILHTAYYILLLIIGFIAFSFPFSLHFKPFASGIGLLCAPEFLTNIGSVGPFIFEADHCQRSPLWQLITLYGFFYFWAILFGIYVFFKIRSKSYGLSKSDFFIGILITISTLLIIIPEIIYVKDIYPAHYRANTMFKLAYQAFIMLSLSSGYIIVRLIVDKFSFLKNFQLKILMIIVGSGTIILVFLYPYYAINSYFGELKIYRGLNGINYLKTTHPEDLKIINWINKNIKDQPVILEAQGDSYTDYGRISANTGLPTVLGWTVHEWLWRGTYDVPAPRIQEVEKMYKSDENETKRLLKKYNVKFVIVGDLERQKYPNLNEKKFYVLGKIIYQTENTRFYEVN